MRFHPRLLVPSVGRKVPLVRLLREWFEVFVSDRDPEAPGAMCVDAAHYVPQDLPMESKWLLGVCAHHGINAILPVRNTDCVFLARMTWPSGPRPTVFVSSPEACVLCEDKLALARSFPGLVPETVEQPPIRFPAFVKLRHGAGSLFCARVRNEEELAEALVQCPGPAVIQPFLPGPEVTVDMFFGPGGKLVQWVPRWRLAVQGGQMSKGVVDLRLKRHLERRVWALRERGGFFGPVNAQFVRDASGRFWLTDLNPRISGGYPLTHAAGGNFVKLLWEVAQGRVPRPGTVKDGTTAFGYTDYAFGGA